MKIEYTEPEEVRFSNLINAETFTNKNDDGVYFKTESALLNGAMVNAVDLKTGSLVKFDPDNIIYPINSKLTISERRRGCVTLPDYVILPLDVALQPCYYQILFLEDFNITFENASAIINEILLKDPNIKMASGYIILDFWAHTGSMSYARFMEIKYVNYMVKKQDYINPTRDKYYVNTTSTYLRGLDYNTISKLKLSKKQKAILEAKRV